LPILLPILARVSTGQARQTRIGYLLGDCCGRPARTPAATLPRFRRVGPAEAATLVPRYAGRPARRPVGWDGQVVDDARWS